MEVELVELVGVGQGPARDHGTLALVHAELDCNSMNSNVAFRFPNDPPLWARECNFTGCELAIPRLLNNAIEANPSVDKGLVAACL